ncbi:hypothetical protein BS47DRAFT_1383373 [Hydnum rufescens UP504]|uniref:DUF6534 domain-containing protein n=1 Tax=Hydnum rufescens UP504 TaxID=1448309 RepID=A0A9P6ATT4_9AGAM|nr:hypothetical protein BS47DRAFT_1383373 [Hydnum rufescens UP504]
MPSSPFIMAIMDVRQVNILAGSFVGILLTALCFGVLTVQTCTYYNAFPNDARPLKLAVGLLWVLQAFQLLVSPFGALQLFPGNNVETCYWPTPCTLYSACCTQTVYRWSVANHNNRSALEWGSWEFGMHQINTVCSSVTVQTFFAYRVYSLSASLYTGVLVQVLVFIQFGFGAAVSVKTHMNQEFKVIIKECTWLIVTWLAIQATADIVIATCMSLLLRRRRTGFQKTDSVINRMALYTISTGLITSILSCSLLATFVKYGFHFSEPTLGIPLGSCYCITMLASLHMRTRLRARLAAPSPLELIGTIKKIMRQNAGDHRNEARFQATRINITTAVVNDVVDMPPHILQGPDFPNS